MELPTHPQLCSPCPLPCRWTTYCAYVPQQDRHGNAVTCAREAYTNHTWDAEQKYTSFGGGGMPLSEQRKFKYTFSTDGLGCSNRFQKLLATGQARPACAGSAAAARVLAPAGVVAACMWAARVLEVVVCPLFPNCLHSVGIAYSLCRFPNACLQTVIKQDSNLTGVCRAVHGMPPSIPAPY